MSYQAQIHMQMAGFLAAFTFSVLVMDTASDPMVVHEGTRRDLFSGWLFEENGRQYSLIV
jgi:hypothetical protein